MHPLLVRAQQQGLTRRDFLRNLLLSAGSVALASRLTACGGSNVPGPLVGGGWRSPFADMGPLLAPDENGVQLPAGFRSRVVAVVNEPPIPSNPSFLWHSDPDGGAVFRTDDGGWIYLSNSEARDATTLFGQLPAVPVISELATRESLELLSPIVGPVTGLLPLSPPLVLPFKGGVSALRFDKDGNLVDAYPVQRNTTTNCSGGATPWGTWINGEEIVDGYMFECSPLRDGGTPIRLDRFGRKAHEMVAVDVAGRAIYHTEDLTGSDRFYRTVFPAQAWPAGGKPDYSQGVLQVLAVDAGLAAARRGPTPIRWINAIDDGRPQYQVYLDEATIFAGNEGVWFLNGFVFFTSKGDDNIWAIDTIGGTIESIYNPEDGPIGSPVDPNEPKLAGVDNIAMTLDGEMIVVEDGGDMRAMVLLPDRSTIPLLRLPGDPAVTEVTGVAFSPDGRRLYVANQRALRMGQPAAFGLGGVVYEITMPFAVRVNPPLARAL
ncbi:alkaline phosphatase PhoX [Sinimarinibacterium thermocellulolyticum]|uniref:Alkaline phosphatase PhoX n=1 Tax=Sinimarinibacterium thermocellulolyticum TaxID=3170016 RepID=A0ABV2A8C3_9GAMM